jgi:hypothetical protein
MPIPLTLPSTAIDVDSSPLRVEISTVTSERIISLVPQFRPSLASDLLASLNAGAALDRTEELIRLAEEVASRPVGLPSDWAASLGRDFSLLDD